MKNIHNYFFGQIPEMPLKRKRKMELNLSFHRAALVLPNNELLEIEIQKIDIESYILVINYGTDNIKTYSCDSENPFLCIDLDTGKLK